jgi:hypothetical protein
VGVREDGVWAAPCGRGVEEVGGCPLAGTGEGCVVGEGGMGECGCG